MMNPGVSREVGNTARAFIESMKAHLGEDEELLWDMATDMEPEDGHIPSNSRQCGSDDKRLSERASFGGPLPHIAVPAEKGPRFKKSVSMDGAACTAATRKRSPS
jgi:hypothetical protein